MCSCCTKNIMNCAQNSCYNNCPREPCCNAFLFNPDVNEPEEKFSKRVTPSFLLNRGDAPKKKAKPRSCSCPVKKKAVSPKCKCRDKGVDTCDLHNEECEKNCERTGEEYPQRTVGEYQEIPFDTSLPGSRQDVMQNGYSATQPRMNEANGSAPIRAAGLPSKFGPPFDPCTGCQYCCPVQPPPAPLMPMAVAPMPTFIPCFCYPNVQLCPQPGGCYPSAPQPGYPDEEYFAHYPPSTTKEMDTSGEKTSEVKQIHAKRNNEQTSQLDRRTNTPKVKLSKPNSVKQRKDPNNELQLVNCTNASPELIKRICKSLQLSRPPDNCFLLLPVTMMPKTARSDETIPNKKQNKKVSIETQSKSLRMRRNCSCKPPNSKKNDPEENLQLAEMEDNESNDVASNNCCACSSRRCCRPNCSYYYNPCTGCYYWCNNCCCCNGCCTKSSNSCPNSCPLPQRATNTKPDAPKRKAAPDSSKSENADRVAAGAVTHFKPEIEELYERWLAFNQYALKNAGRTPPRSAPVYYDSIHYKPFQFPYRKTQKMRTRQTATDIDWAPH